MVFYMLSWIEADPKTHAPGRFKDKVFCNKGEARRAFASLATGDDAKVAEVTLKEFHDVKIIDRWERPW